jgi:hypothetical protein
MKTEIGDHHIVKHEDGEQGTVIPGQQAPPREPRSYACQLRAIGQAVEKFNFSILELEHNSGSYRLIGGGSAVANAARSLTRRVRELFLKPFRPAGNGPSSEPVVLQFSLEEIERFDLRGQSCRRNGVATPDPNSISQILRSAGSYLDQKEGVKLLNISLSDKSLTITYQSPMGRPMQVREALQSVYDFWVKMYLHRSNRPTPPPPSDPTFHVNWKGRGNA